VKQKKWFGYNLGSSGQLVVTLNPQRLLQYVRPSRGRLVDIPSVETLGDKYEGYAANTNSEH
jgi:hypothetical protein